MNEQSILSVRLPAALKQQLADTARARGINLTALVKLALEQELLKCKANEQDRVIFDNIKRLELLLNSSNYHKDALLKEVQRIKWQLFQ